MARGTVNKVIILGRLGQDPDVRATASGTQVVNLQVATNELGPKDQNGNRQDQTEWHRIVLFGRMAENAAQYLRKGSQVYIEGRLQTRKWQDQSGNDRYSTEIVGHEMQFIGGNQGQQQQAPDQTAQGYGRAMGQNTQQPTQQPQQGFGNQQGGPAPQPNQGGGFDDFDPDVPF